MNEGTDHVWKMLDDDLHLQTLDPNYAPVGLLEMVSPAPKRVLDLGCFCGGSGRWLKQRFPGCDVVGIELLDRAAAVAAQTYDRVITGALEQVDFAAQRLTAGSFDAIIAADVPEHIYNPWQALQRVKPFCPRWGDLHQPAQRQKFEYSVCSGRRRMALPRRKNTRYYPRPLLYPDPSKRDVDPDRLADSRRTHAPGSEPVAPDLGKSLSQIDMLSLGKLKLE